MASGTRYAVALGVILAMMVGAGFRAPPWLAQAVCVLLLLGFILLAGRAITGLWWGALIDERNKMSLSRLQLMLWTVVILGSFFAAVLINLSRHRAAMSNPLAIGIPQQLWALMGISTTALVGSPLIRSTKRASQPSASEAERSLAAIAAAKGVSRQQLAARGLEVVNKSPTDARWSDLVEGEETGNGAHLDLGKVQNLYFTLVLVVVYVATLASSFLDGKPIEEFPPLDDGMLALLGISHVGYLGLKATPAGPRNSTAEAPGSTAEGTAARRSRAGEEHPETEAAP